MKRIAFLTLLSFASTAAFSQPQHSLEVTVYGNPSTSSELNATGYSIDLEPVEYNTCGPIPMIAIAIIDSTSCQPLSNCNRNFGQYNIYDDPDGDCITDLNTIHVCRTREEHYFLFKSIDSTQVQGMLALLDSIEPGHWIIAYSIFPSEFSSMTPDFATTFQQFGSTLIPTLADHLPFIFFCKKGDAGSVIESVGSAPNSLITVQTSFQCSPSAVNEIFFEMGGTVFPNPVTDKLHLKIPDDIELPLLLSLYDSVGKLVFQQRISTPQESVDTENFNSGIYILKFTGADCKAAVRLAVMHE